MSLYSLVKAALPGAVVSLACLLPVSTYSQAARSITLDPPTGWELQAHTMDSKGNLLPAAPANFRRLGEATIGKQADLHTLTLRFSQTTRITAISITRDFVIEQGGSCVEGNVYEKDSTCRLLVRFTPQGPGNRLGKLTVSHTASATPDAFGIGGYGYAPIVSFIPSMITTVNGTYPASVGLLSGAQNLTIDGGDTLWVSDSGNKVIRNMDSSAVFKTLTTTATAPLGIAVDTFGEAYFDEPSANTMHEIYDYGPVVQVNGSGTASCPASTPCNLNSEALGQPGAMSIDAYNHLFFVDSHQGSAMATVQPLPAKLIFLYNPFPFQTNPSNTMAADAGDNLYSLWYNGSVCEIVQASLYNAENSNVYFNKIAGGHTCGFSGDSGLAGNAEIGNSIGQITFDTAGDLYFTDAANQRVRRIDYVTGVIHTIAGNGTAGYTGDNSAATNAGLSAPTGVGVDSQGQVFIISSAASGQVIRKVTATGYRTFTSTPKGSHSTAFTETVTNTGNSNLVITNTAMLGTNPGDFAVDPTTTSCLLTAGSTLYSGQTCLIGFICTPSASGARSARFVINDNSVANSNSIDLSCTGTLPVPTFKITAPANGASFTSGTAVTFSVSVTSTSSPAPTGTVQFMVDGANYGSPVTVSSGAASTSVTGLTTKSHTLSATYSGDSNYAAAGPLSVTITVTGASKPAASVSLVPAISPAASCQPPAYTVTVTAASGVPTGSVQLLNGDTVLASNKVSNGKALLAPASLPAGRYSLTARYSGDTLHAPATSPALDEYVSTPSRCGQLNGHPVLPARTEMH